MADTADYPALLRAVRARLDLTQEQLAERLGASFASVNRWEGGVNTPQKAARAAITALAAEAGVIDLVDFAAERNGERDLNPARLVAVVETFSDPRYRLGLADVQPDFLGRAYEYLLRKFAEGSWQSAGEFFTPTEVGFLMAHLMRPGPGEACHDYACGSAGLLVKLQLVARERDPTSRVPLRLSGPPQELHPGSLRSGRNAGRSERPTQRAVRRS